MAFSRFGRNLSSFCFIAVLALGSVAWAGQEQDESPPLDMTNPANLITIQARTYTLNAIPGGGANESHRDGQWSCSHVASDGKVYFGDSSHDWKTPGMFCQYDPATQQVHVLCPDIDVVCGEAAAVAAGTIRPQGKLHSDCQEDLGNGYLYFGTYYGYTGAPYTGGHVIRYQLGSFEANAPHFDDKGIPNSGAEIYAGICVDSINHKVYVNSGDLLYRYNCDATTTNTYLGNIGGQDFFQFCDSQGNFWSTSYGNYNGNLFKVTPGNVLTTYNAILPPISYPNDPNDLGTNYDQSGRYWNWGAKWGADKFVFCMRQDGALYVFDAAKADANDMGHAVTKVAHIGIGGLDMCLGGSTVYFAQSATPWGAAYTDPITHAATTYSHDAKARDNHLKSINLTDPNHVIKDWGRLIDPVGRVPWRTEGMSADANGNVYLTGDWHLLRLGHDAWGNVSTDPNVPLDPNEIPYGVVRMDDNNPGQYFTADMWRGQFFAVVNTGVPSNMAPVVSAGTNQIIRQPVMSASLAGTVSDDGLPAGAAVTSTWTVTSGPGNITFGNASAAATTATFSTLGTYVLRLTASDTALIAFAEVQITAAAPQTNLAPVVSAGADQMISLPVTSVSLAGTVSDDGLPAGAAVTAAWSLQSGPGTVTFANAAAAATTATFSTTGTYVLRLTASDTALQAYAQCTITVSTSNELPYGGTPWPVPGRIEAENYDVGGQNVAYYDTTPGNAGGAYRTDDVDIRATSDVGGGYIVKQIAAGEWLKYTVNIAYTGRYNISVRAATGGTSGNYVHIECDGNDVTGHINLAVTPDFDACVTNTVNNCWLTAGIHVLRLYFDTGQYNVNWIELDLANAMPTASAGLNQKVMIPNALTLAGTISDDGQPTPPAVCTAAWSVVSGPGTVTFANPAAAGTTATFATAGTYVLMLTASDSALTATSNMTVTALAPGDFNGDGRVDGVDFLNWQSHYPTASGATCDHGDANGDGKVDGVDFLAWQSHYHG